MMFFMRLLQCRSASLASAGPGRGLAGLLCADHRRGGALSDSVRPPRAGALRADQRAETAGRSRRRAGRESADRSSSRIIRRSRFCSRCADAADPAMAVVERLRAHVSGRAFAADRDRRAALSECQGLQPGRMLAAARHDLLVMADSDIRVTRDMLRDDRGGVSGSAGWGWRRARIARCRGGVSGTRWRRSG